MTSGLMDDSSGAFTEQLRRLGKACAGVLPRALLTWRSEAGVGEAGVVEHGERGEEAQGEVDVLIVGDPAAVGVAVDDRSQLLRRPAHIRDRHQL